jgi:hypothetical protein
MVVGVDPLSVGRIQDTPTLAALKFTGIEELLETKLTVFVILGPFCGEVSVIEVGLAIKVGNVAGVMMRVTGSWSGEFVALE